ncbi:hypothetical protein Syun_020677 [Stephania yunnanensis]|uniref:Peroxidase n=1 Tax=Stephania yunnanensis TaxID=152371 RepID=A0AAP0IEX3_9MAGN
MTPPRPRPPSFLLLIFLFISSSYATLTANYYSKSCPNLETIIRDIVINKQISNPTTAAGTLRLFFHDCMVHGCDASILISPNSSSSGTKPERDADINTSLPGDAFDLIIRAKAALELQCPGIVSCSDILALATRNLISMVGGPLYTVHLGRKDGLVSDASHVEGDLPRPTMSLDQNIKVFQNKGFSIQEMVALIGGHTIGFSHCKEFANRIFHYNKNSPVDPAMNPRFATRLRELCKGYEKNTTVAAFNDVMTPGKFDNMYYKNLKRGLGLLSSDQGLGMDKRTMGFVELYAANETAFFEDFKHAMEKLSEVEVKSGSEGEVRRMCDMFNA